MALVSSAIRSLSPKKRAVIWLISGCIFTILMEFFCTHTDSGMSTILLISVNRIMARP